MELIQTISYSQEEILNSILQLYVPDGRFEVDSTYSKGSFYRKGKVPQPIHRFDLNPQCPEVHKADCRALPFEDGTVHSIIFDPPFLATKGPSLQTQDGNRINRRFSVCESEKELSALYRDAMTLASKHKSSVRKMLKQYKDGKGGWCIPYETRGGRKCMYFAKYQECKAPKDAKDAIPYAVPQTIKSHSSFESRLLAKQCEFCGSTDGKSYEVHHVHKLKDLKGKSILEQVMLARRRKTIVLCEKCHHNLHNGKA